MTKWLIGDRKVDWETDIRGPDTGKLRWCFLSIIYNLTFRH